MSRPIKMRVVLAQKQLFVILTIQMQPRSISEMRCKQDQGKNIDGAWMNQTPANKDTVYTK